MPVTFTNERKFFESILTAGIARMVRKSARLVYLLLCYIDGAKIKCPEKYDMTLKLCSGQRGHPTPKSNKKRIEIQEMDY